MSVPVNPYAPFGLPLDDEQRAELAKRSAEARAKFAAIREARRAALIADIAAAVLGQQRTCEPSASLLVDADEAARLLDITRAALDKRVARAQMPVGSIKRTGRRIQFVRAKLIEARGGAR